MAKTIKGIRRFYDNARDCGRVGRNMEVDARINATPRTRVLRCQRDNRLDHTMKVEGQRTKIEIKTNCGTVTDCFLDNVFEGLDLNDRDAISQYILPKVDLVVYGYDVHDGYDVNDDLFVFSRDQFLDFLFGYNKPMVKVNHKDGGYCLNIQTYTNSKKRFEYVENTCLDMDCYGLYLESIGRKNEQ